MHCHYLAFQMLSHQKNLFLLKHSVTSSLRMPEISLQGPFLASAVKVMDW